MKKLKRILLVDDNEMDNFFHEYVLRKADVAQEIIAVESAEAAIAYLGNPDSLGVDLIFLDINMPGMNGFDFVKALPDVGVHTALIIIVMLTSSPAPEDVARAQSYPAIRQYITKPLTAEMAREITAKYF